MADHLSFLQDKSLLSQHYNTENILPLSLVNTFCFTQLSKSKLPDVLNYELIREMLGATISKHFNTLA